MAPNVDVETYAKYLVEMSHDNGHRMGPWKKPGDANGVHAYCTVCGGKLSMYMTLGYELHHWEETLSSTCAQFQATKVMNAMAALP